MTGVSAMSVEATPIRDAWTAIIDNHTPRNGPENAPPKIATAALESARTVRIGSPRLSLHDRKQPDRRPYRLPCGS